MSIISSAVGMKAKTFMSFKRNAPALLTALGVSGTLSTAYLTAKASFEASELLNEQDESEPLTTRESIELVWPCYIRPVVSGTVTIVCIVGANRIGARRAATAYSILSVSEKAFEEYREKVKDLIGDTKEEKLRAEVAQARMERDPPSDNQVMISGPGKVLCMEDLTGRYFHSDMETLRKAQNDINAKLLRDMSMYVTLNEFYYLLDLEQTGHSGLVGWQTGRPLELEFTAALYKSEPCMVVTYNYLDEL